MEKTPFSILAFVSGLFAPCLYVYLAEATLDLLTPRGDSSIRLLIELDPAVITATFIAIAGFVFLVWSIAKRIELRGWMTGIIVGVCVWPTVLLVAVGVAISRL